MNSRTAAPDVSPSPATALPTPRTGRRTGRPPLTDAARLLAAARDLGFQQPDPDPDQPSPVKPLSVGAVTKKVGVKYSTFYRHFASIDDLVAALADDVLRTDLPDSADADDWRGALADLTWRVIAVLQRWPGMATAVAAMPDLPATLAAERTRPAELLCRTGVDPEQAELMVDSVLIAIGVLPPRADTAAADLVITGIAAQVGRR